MMRGVLVLALSGLLAACTPHSVVKLPQHGDVASRDITFRPDQLPPPQLRVYAGDTLRIVRDAQIPIPGQAEDATSSLYLVQADGSFAYPYIGKVQAAGRSPEEIGADISARQAGIYRQPQVTVNVALAPGNRIYVGGAVRAAGAFDLASVATAEQALVGSGVLNTADIHHVALVRLDAQGRRQVYFFDYSALLKPGQAGLAPVGLQRGDILFVPNSHVGNAVQSMDLYVTQLLPFFHGIGIGANYQINNVDSIRYNNTTNNNAAPSGLGNGAGQP